MPLLMEAAYIVHGAVAPVLPFEIPREQKLQIKGCIALVERAVDAMIAPPIVASSVGSKSERRKKND